MKKRFFLFQFFLDFPLIASGIIGFIACYILLGLPIAAEEGGFFNAFGQSLEALYPFWVLLMLFGILSVAPDFFTKMLSMVVVTLGFIFFTLVLFIFFRLCIDACSDDHALALVTTNIVFLFEALFILNYFRITIKAHRKKDTPK